MRPHHWPGTPAHAALGVRSVHHAPCLSVLLASAAAAPAVHHATVPAVILPSTVCLTLPLPQRGGDGHGRVQDRQRSHVAGHVFGARAGRHHFEHRAAHRQVVREWLAWLRCCLAEQLSGPNRGGAKLVHSKAAVGTLPSAAPPTRRRCRLPPQDADAGGQRRGHAGAQIFGRTRV